MKPMKFINKKAVTAFAGTLLILAAFQNCGKGFEVAGKSSLSSSSLGTFAADCLSDLSFAACLFDKDPTQSQVTDQQLGLAAFQTLGVKLPNRPDPALLANENIIVVGQDATPLPLPPQGIEALPENEATLSALMAFYWGDRAMTLLKRAPLLKNALSPVRVLTGAPATGYVSSENLVLIKNSADGLQKVVGYDATFMTHIVVEAAIAQATGNAIYSIDADSNHRDCGTLEGPVYKLDCCSTLKGCSKALTSGLGDYFTAIMFLDAPGVGAYASDTPGGMNICGIQRNPAGNLGLTLTTAFDRCKDTGREGQIYNMGALLASALYTVRAQSPAADRSQFDVLIATSLTTLQPTDTFETYLNSLKSIDQLQFKKKFSDRLQKEAIRREIVTITPAPAPVREPTAAE